MSPPAHCRAKGDVEDPHQREEGEDHEMQEHEMRPKGLERGAGIGSSPVHIPRHRWTGAALTRPTRGDRRPRGWSGHRANHPGMHPTVEQAHGCLEQTNQTAQQHGAAKHQDWFREAGFCPEEGCSTGLPSSRPQAPHEEGFTAAAHRREQHHVDHHADQQPPPKGGHLNGRVPTTNRLGRNHTVASVAFVRFMYVQENASNIKKITTDHAAATPTHRLGATS